jgi:hypothetical protein
VLACHQSQTSVGGQVFTCILVRSSTPQTDLETRRLGREYTLFSRDD